jgi:hypothetical protein
MNVPERFYQDFVSDFPAAATLSDVASRGLVFAQAGLSNLVRYTAWEAARRVEAIALAPAMAAGAGELFSGFAGYMGAIQAMDSVRVPGLLLQTGDAFSAVASAMGAFESVPIVGVILDFAMTMAEGGILTYGYAHQQEIEAEPFGYARDADEDWTRATLRLHAGGDLTPMFLPRTDASAGVDRFNVEVAEGWTGVQTEVTRAIYVPHGTPTANIGGLPNTPQIPAGWEVNMDVNPYTRPGPGIPWVAFRPSSSQAVLASWQSVLRNSRACYLVDAVRVADAWLAWQDHMQVWGWGTRYEGENRVRIAALSRPPVSVPNQNRISADGFARLVPWWPGEMAGKSSGWKPHYGPMTGDVGAWAARVQLGRRQRKYLGTLTCAYVSEADPAFQSDPMLRALLEERRRMLLDHVDVVHVDLARVVDDGFRSAVATRQGPKGFADAPQGAPEMGSITARPDEQTSLPPVAVQRIVDAAPMLDKSARSGETRDMRGAAFLALLGFLVR